MVYVISACADQSEAINAAMPKDAINNPYHLLDVLPGAEKSLDELKIKDGFSIGTQNSMLRLIGTESPALNAIQKEAWNKGTIFGKVVCHDKLLPFPHIF